MRYWTLYRFLWQFLIESLENCGLEPLLKCEGLVLYLFFVRGVDLCMLFWDTEYRTEHWTWTQYIVYLLNWIIEETTHNPEVAGSSPVPAPIRKTVFRLKYGLFLHFLKNFMEFYLWMKSCFDPDLAPRLQEWTWYGLKSTFTGYKIKK